MALLHVIDRPEGLAASSRSPHGIGAILSAASHLLLGLTAIAVMRTAPAREIVDATARFDPQRLIWLPNASDGRGRESGGDRSAAPARRARSRGTDSISVPAASQPSSTSRTDSPLDPISITARPMGDATQALAGSITSDTPGDALGRNDGAGGDGTDSRPGDLFGQRGLGGPGVTTPVIIHQVKPQYTAEAMRAKIQGAVWLECIVLTDGTVGEVRVRRSLDSVFGLDEQAVAAAKQWRFKPGLLSGQPVPVAVTIELTFTLR